MNCKGKMSFGNFIFPVNPYLIRITQQRTVAEQKVPFGDNIISDMGQNSRRISGEGEFYGEDARQSFLRLKEVFEKSGCNVLYLPSQKPMYAAFASLELIGEDVGDVIRYRFSFVEHFGKKTAKKLTQKIADGKRCLWDYAYESNLPVETLLRLNPNVRRPDVPIAAGRKVFFC